MNSSAKNGVKTPTHFTETLTTLLRYLTPSIQGYLILDQKRVFAEWHTRAEGGWHLRQFTDPADEIELAPLGCALALSQLYRGLKLDA